MKLEISAFGSVPAEVHSISRARTTIGRNPENDIVVDSRIMSGTHAQILLTSDGRFSIEDLGSINGTFVNGERVTGASIKPGDKLKFGNHEALLLDSEDSPDSQSAEPPGYGSLAMSQARQAMEKLKQGLPSGSEHSLEWQSDAAKEKEAEESTVEDAPASAPVEASAGVQAGEQQKLADSLEKITAERDELATAGLEKDRQIETLQAVIDAAGETEKRESALRIELGDVKQARDEFEEQLRSQAAKIQAFQEQMNDENRDRSKMVTAVSELRTRLKQVAAERDAIAAQRDGLAEDAKKFEQAATENAGRRTEMDTVVSDLRDQIDQVAAERDELAADLKKLEPAAAEAGSLRAELEAEVSELRAQLEQVLLERDGLAAETEKFKRTTIETARLRVELGALKEAHGEVADARAEFAAIQQEQSQLRQEIESCEPERANVQQELADFLARAEAAKAAALAENAEVARALEASHAQLEALNQRVNQAQQEEDARHETVLAGIRELEQQQQTEAEALARIEERKAAAERECREVADSTQALESKGREIDSQIAKGEKALKGIHRKIAWRRKLLVRLKTVARREREVAKQIEAGKRYLEAAEAQKSSGNASSSVQPWDVDRALATRDQAIEEARMIQQEADLVKAALEEKQQELERLEAEIRENQQEPPNPFSSAVEEAPNENSREREEPIRLAARLREVRQGLTAEVL